MTRPQPRPGPRPGPAARDGASATRRRGVPPWARRVLGPPPDLLARVGWVPFACLIAAVLVASVAGIVWNSSPYYGRNDHQAAPAQAVGTVPAAPARHFSAINLSPNRIAIPRLKVTAPIVRVGTTPDGELEVPLNPKKVGWWSPGAKPGAKKGTAILAGHINYAGVTGSMAHIGRLDPDDTIRIYGKYTGKNTVVDYRVTGVRTYHKTTLPYKQIFDQRSVGRMALVTCGGPFDASTGNYLDNIVVFGVPVSSHAV